MLELLVYAVTIWAALTALASVVLFVVTIAERVFRASPPAGLVRERGRDAEAMRVSAPSDVSWNEAARAARRLSRERVVAQSTRPARRGRRTPLVQTGRSR
jgi:hypothetical protein